MPMPNSKNTRGGGGMCPVKGHGKLLRNLDVSQLASLGKASEGTKRELLAIPEGFCLENTGIRIEVFARTNGNSNGSSAPADKQFRGRVFATPVAADVAVVEGGKKKQLRSVELPRRNEPSWSGLHLHLNSEERLVVHVQERRFSSGNYDGDGNDNNTLPWTDSFPPFTIEPLKAFTIEDQDVAWLKAPVELTSTCPHSPDVVLWAELSLQRNKSSILEQAKGTNIASRQRQHKITKTNIEPTPRDAEEIKSDQLIFEEVLGGASSDPMTKQDIVYMKDIWNKCLGWIAMTGEHFVESLFLRCPDLLQTMGDIPAELAFDMFVSIIDLSVRALDRRTEVIARETYRVMPLRPEVDAPFKTVEEGFTQFAQLGMRPKHWKEARALFLFTIKNVSPYLEENDRELLELGVDSCAYRFWTYRIMASAFSAIQELDSVFDSEENKNILAKSFEPLSADKVRSGILFYQTLFKSHPEVIQYFGRSDMDFLAGHLFDAIDMLSNVMNNFEKAIPILHHLGKIHDMAKIPVFTYPAIGDVLDGMLREILPLYGDGTEEGEKLVRLWSALMNRTVLVCSRISFVSERLLRKAFEWVDQVAHELKWDPAYLEKRRVDIEGEVRMRGSYTHTEEEVVHGARVAWRNSAKCIGRIAWNTLMVRDRRHVTNLDAMFAECLEHQRLATADGSLKAVMTVFRPRQPGTRMGTRFWNLQLVRFACYENEDGILMGDRANKAYTDECIVFGWKPPVPRTEFDVLPIVIEDPIAGTTKMFELPEEYHRVSMISHPKYPDFAKLGLRWCVVPTVTCFTMKIGGLEYPCNPFNGWFMETEITRDLLEPGRMDKMIPIAHAVGIDTEDEDDFWRERVAIETNKAIMHSFRADGHSIVDHVTAQGQFLAHDAREKREGRECPAQWSWVVPAFGGSTMPIWHHEMRDFYLEPSYDYQAEIYAVRKESKVKEEELLAMKDDDDNCEKLLIIFASVTGKAENYAYRAKKLLRPLQVSVASCESIKPADIWAECIEGGGKYSAILLITSTFGEGMPPPSAEHFFKDLKSLPGSALAGVSYSVMAIGSTVYPDYCQAGIDLDKAFSAAGGHRLLPLMKGDEMNGQEDAVLRWISSVGSMFNLEQKKAIAIGDSRFTEELEPVTVEMLNNDDERVEDALIIEKNLVPNDPSAGAMARFLPKGYKLCSTTMNDELVDFSTVHSEKLFRSTRHLEFSLDQDQIYETGDHARILPMNDASVVLEMCSCLRLQPGQWVHAIVDGPSLSTPTMRVGDLLSLEIDLATSDSDGNLPFLKKLLHLAHISNDLSAEFKAELDMLEQYVEKLEDAGHLAKVKADKMKNIIEEGGRMRGNSIDEIGGIGGMGTEEAVRNVAKDKRKKPAVPMNALVQQDGKKQAISSIIEHYLTIPELLEQFPHTSKALSLADCIETLPRITPRHYSIASASEMCPTRLQICVGKLTVIHKSTGRKRRGVCSHFLAATRPSNGNAHNCADLSNCGVFSANAKSFVRLGLSRSAFRLPKDFEAPLIMIGPGTGIAPMLAFLQCREKALSHGKKLGHCMVFFGCRSENDFLHSTRMRKWVESGVISNLLVAFSRHPDRPKQYVQHVVAQHRDTVWKILSAQNCHYYICGDSQMAEDVFDELKTTSKVVGGLDHFGSFQFFQRMKIERRFQMDTWGVVTKKEQNLKRLVSKRYNKAESWLKEFDEGKE